MTEADRKRLEQLYIYPAYAEYFDVSVDDITDHESYTDDDDQLLDWSGYDKMIRRSDSSITHVAQRVRTALEKKKFGIDYIDMSIRVRVPSGRETELDKMRNLLSDPSLSAPSVYMLFRSPATKETAAVSRGFHDAWVLDYRKMAETAVSDRVQPRYQGWSEGDYAHFYDLETLEDEGVVIDRIPPSTFSRIRRSSLGGTQTSLTSY